MHDQKNSNYVSRTKNSLVRNGNEIELLEDGEMEVFGKKCLWYTYNRTENGIRREMKYYSIPINGTSYGITAGVNLGGMNKYNPIFDQIVKTFKLRTWY